MKTFIQDKIRNIYHNPNCPYAKSLAKEDKRTINEHDAFERELIPCRHCQSLSYIFQNHMESYINNLKSKHLSYMLDGNWLLIQTEVSFWKIGYDRYTQKFFLFHGNTAPEDNIVTVHDKQDYHRQSDVMFMRSITEYFDYIYEHDRFRRGDYNCTPRGTKSQRDKCARAKKNLKKAERARVYALLEQMSTSA